MERTRVICDACGKDITTTPHFEEWYLRIRTMPRQWEGGAEGRPATEVKIASPLPEQVVDFCDLKCLAAWLSLRTTPEPTGG